MLNLLETIPQIAAMVKNQANFRYNMREKLDLAMEKIERYDKNYIDLLQKLCGEEQRLLAAFPTGKITDCFGAGNMPEKVMVVATDGSQIEPSTHEIALFYMINIAVVSLVYGGSVSPSPQIEPYFFYDEKDLYIEEDYHISLINARQLAQKRSTMEKQALKEELLKYADRKEPLVGLTDGPLLDLNRSQKYQYDLKEKVAVDDLLEMGKKYHIPIAGYISATRNTALVNLVKLSLCPEPLARCKQCEARKQKRNVCRVLNDLNDAQIIERFLPAGARSTVFYLINKLPMQTSETDIGFFYLNTGREIARIEAPRYVLENKEMLEYLHGVLLQQIRLGLGYPAVLSQAHEYAVITGKEREQVYKLLQKQMIRNGVEIKLSQKQLRKRRPLG